MKKWLATFGGAGFSPVAPGTAGSLLAAILLLPIWLIVPMHFDLLVIAILIASSAMTIWLGQWSLDYFGKKDPGAFVLDEVAGICLTLIAQPKLPGMREAWIVAAAFLAFRIFDVTKPRPCRQLEKLPLGWGILMDDLAAAVYANIACQLFCRLALPKLIGS